MKKQKNRYKKARYILTAFILLAAASQSSCSAKQQSMGSKGYDSPEKAVSAYLDGFKKMDLEQMMGTFAIDNFAENYDFEGRMNRIRAYVYGSEIKLPNATPLAIDLNIESRRASISTSVLFQYVSLSSPGFELTEIQPLKDEGEAKEFADQFTRSLESVRTDSIKLLGFIPPEELSDIYTMDTNLENIARLAKIYGADGLVSRAAVLELDGETYLMCADVADYGGKWYLATLGGNMGNMLGIDMMRGGLVPLSAIDMDGGWEERMVPAP